MQQTSSINNQETAQVRTLANGVTLLLEPLPYLRTVTAGVWVKAGSGNEPLRLAGISHFLEHLFFKGTQKRSAHDLMAEVERRGGHMNAFTSRDYTCVYIKALDKHVASGIEILADIIKNSQFLDFEKERNVILEEIASIEDVPEEYVHDVYSERLWPGHPLGQPVTGTLGTVSAITVNDVRAYFQAWYKPENMLISVVGNFDPNAMHRQLADEFEGLPKLAPPDRVPPPQTASGFEFLERDIAQDHICFGFPGARATDSSRFVYEVLGSVLGGGSTSRLFEKVREEAGLAYSIYTFTSSYYGSGTIGVYAAVAPENADQALDLCTNQLRDLRDNPIAEDELELNKEQLKGGVLMALESTSSRMSRLAKTMMYHGRIIPVDEIIERIDAVTAADIQLLAQELFRRDRSTAIVLGPVNGRLIEDLPL